MLTTVERSRRSYLLLLQLILAPGWMGCPGSSPEKHDGGTIERDGGGPISGRQCDNDENCRARFLHPELPECAETKCDVASGLCKFLALDGDQDGFRDANCRSESLTIDPGLDCDDDDRLVHPDGIEVCDQKDNNCNGEVNENIAPNPNRPCTAGKGVCARAGFELCGKDGLWNRCSAEPFQPAPDAPRCREEDFACDGRAGCECVHGKHRPCPNSPEGCKVPEQVCVDGRWSECSATPRIRHCPDGDGDGFRTSNDGACKGLCPDEVGSGWLAAQGSPAEAEACDNDRNRHPGAVPACGADQDCDGRPDVPVGGDCNAENTSTEPCTVSNGCDQTNESRSPGRRACNLQSQCRWGECIPEPQSDLVWKGQAERIQHRCGRPGPNGDSWFVPNTSDHGCFAQFGPYVNSLRPGRYKIGVKVKIGQVNESWFRGAPFKGLATLEADVVADMGSRKIASSLFYFYRGDGCIQFRDVELIPCSDTEIRVRYRGWDGWHDFNFEVLSTRIAPEGEGGACE